MQFEDLALSQKVQQALLEIDFTHPTPIQEKAIPEILRRNDIIGVAPTGTGKTAAYAIPIINLLNKRLKSSSEKSKPRALVLCPTRELAVQIQENFQELEKFTDLQSVVVFGGASIEPQISQLKKGMDIIIATPGRLLDLRKQGVVNLEEVEILVLDEADLILDMGFIDEVQKILRLASKVEQRLLFSASFSAKVKDLTKNFLQTPQYIEIEPSATIAMGIEEKLFEVDKAKKNDLLLYVLHNISKKASVLIFRKTKYGVEKTIDSLAKQNIDAAGIYGQKSQSERQTTLNSFKAGKTNILVATDLAARGLDIPNLDVVINFDLPEQTETYVHRIGRTGRAGKTGISISFCSPEEKKQLENIEALRGEKIPLDPKNPFRSAEGATPIIHKKSGSKYKKGRKGAGSKAKKKRWY